MRFKFYSSRDMFVCLFCSGGGTEMSASCVPGSKGNRQDVNYLIERTERHRFRPRLSQTCWKRVQQHSAFQSFSWADQYFTVKIVLHPCNSTRKWGCLSCPDTVSNCTCWGTRWIINVLCVAEPTYNNCHGKSKLLGRVQQTNLQAYVAVICYGQYSFASIEA